MKKKHDGYKVVPFPKMRRFALDAGYLGRRRHIVHGLLEVDVTRARQFIRQHKARTGEALSFTAFIITCLARAVDVHKTVHAYRNWRCQLVIFDEVNVNTMIEVEFGGRKIPMPHIIKAANRRSLRDIHDEIRARLEEMRDQGVGYVLLSTRNREALREELGDDNVYDRLLYATGRQNRVAVIDVMRNSPAEQYGLQAGDVVLSYDGRRVFSARELQKATAAGEAGIMVLVEVERDGSRVNLYLPRGPIGGRLFASRVRP